MNPEIPGNESSASDDGKGLQICVLGSDAFNTDLLANWLHDQTGFACRSMRLEAFEGAMDLSKDHTTLIFLDCTGLTTEHVWSLLTVYHASQYSRCLLVLDHVDPGWKIEHKAIDCGAHGILYDHQDIELYPKAVHEVVDGVLWYPRQVLEERLLADYDKPMVPPNGILDQLTMREREVLALVVSGISNQEISEELCISPHTVKTHVYNIFKKINVGSRMEAALWLAENE